MKKNKIIVKTNSGNYPIIIGRNLISNLSKILTNNSIKFEKCLLVIDNNLQKRMVSKIGNVAFDGTAPITAESPLLSSLLDTENFMNT